MKKLVAALSIVATLAGAWIERSALITASAITGLAVLLESNPALAANCSAFTYTLTNGTTADANQVMSNFNTLLNCANNNLAPIASPSFTGTVTMASPLTVPNGGTGLGTLTSGSFVQGNGTSTPNLVSLVGTQTFLGGNVALSSQATYTSAVNTGSIGANGQVWRIEAGASVTDSGSAASVTCRITDLTTHYAAAEGTVSTNGAFVYLYLTAIITQSAADTYYLQCQDRSSTSGVISAQGNAGIGNKETYIIATRQQ